jgi:hypothetical protein
MPQRQLPPHVLQEIRAFAAQWGKIADGPYAVAFLDRPAPLAAKNAGKSRCGCRGARAALHAA